MKPKATTEEKTDVQKAQELLQKVEQEQIQKAGEAFKIFLEAWTKEHDCTIVPFGFFEGNNIKTEIKVVRLKK